MRLVLKVLLTLLLVAVLPVAVSGVTGVVLARDAVSEAAGQQLEAEARHLAELAETTILGSLESLKQASLLGIDRLSAEERSGALWIIYRADTARTAVALIDGKTGESIVDPVFQEALSGEPGLAEHRAFPSAELPLFAKHVPLNEALAAGKAVSVPYASPGRGVPLIALAVRIPGPAVDGVEQAWVVAVELSLHELNERFESAADENFEAFLVDLEGKAVCHTQRTEAISRADLHQNPGVQSLFDTKSGAAGVVNLYDDRAPDLTAWARASRLAAPGGRTWGVVVERNREEALAAVALLSRRTAFWVATALLLAVLAGAILARGIARPVEVLTDIVGRFGRGEASGSRAVRARSLGNDEIGQLGKAFNDMADAIDVRDRQLRSFNEDLQHKVEERTRELREAQNQLIQSQKMAAIGELGAGVAHEINNPLAGVLGSAQLALLRLPSEEGRIRTHLEDIEREGLRIQGIVENLLKLSQDQSQQAMGTVDVNQVVEGALALVARPIIAQRIAVKKELSDHLPKIRGRAGDLQQALLQILNNAKEAMPDGGTLSIRTDTVDGKLVRIVVEDSGHGIPAQNLERLFEPFFTTRASKGHKGMGLAVVHRIVEEHQGRVSAESAPSRGASMKLTFPATRESLHLA